MARWTGRDLGAVAWGIRRDRCDYPRGIDVDPDVLCPSFRQKRLGSQKRLGNMEMAAGIGHDCSTDMRDLYV
jgi:hypothetical protein